MPDTSAIWTERFAGSSPALESRRDLFEGDDTRLPTDEEERFLLDVWGSFLDAAIALDELRRFHEDFYRFDLSRMERERHLKSFLVAFGSELSLFESSSALLSLIGSNANVERFLNVPRPERGHRGRKRRADARRALRAHRPRPDHRRKSLSLVSRAGAPGRSEMAGEGFSWLWDEVEHYVAPRRAAGHGRMRSRFPPRATSRPFCAA